MQRKNINYDTSKVRTILVAVDTSSIPAALQTSVSLGTVEQLRDAVGIIGVEAFNATLMSTSPEGKANMPDACYKAMYLSIYDKTNTEVRSRIPLARLIRNSGNAEIEKMNLFNEKGESGIIDPQRTKIIFGDCALKGAGVCALLEFTYLVA